MNALHAPVLVLGSGLTVLGVVRLLRSAGYDALVVGEDAGLARHSRLFHSVPSSSAAVRPEEDLPAYLNGLPFESGVLLPCSDDWMLRVARCIESGSPRFLASVASPSALEHLIDKWYLAELLTQLSLPLPTTMSVGSAAEIAAIPSSLLGNAFLKPRDSASFYRRFGVKGMRVHSHSEIASKVAMLAGEGLTVELQEYVPGPPTNHYYVEGFIDRNGSTTAIFVRQRLRMYPPDFGNSTAFVSVAPDTVPDAVDTVMRLMKHVQFRGIFSVELKRDERDGICRLIEVNARPWWFIEFAGQCGVNFCEMFVRDALGQPVAPVKEYHVGLECVFPYYDLYACRALHREGKLSLRSWAASWLRATQPVLRWHDPLPAIVASAEIVGEKVRRAIGRKGRTGVLQKTNDEPREA